MLTWIREKFGTIVIGGIIGFLAFVFAFYGVFTPKSLRGFREGAVAGTVNGDPISAGEFQRAYNQRVEFFKNLMGGKVSDAQLKAFNLKVRVFQELVQRKLMIQEARKEGMMAADEEVRDRIREIPAFQVDGKFDVLAYKRVLEANNYSADSFEKMVRDDISQQHWADYFRSRVHVSDEEIQKEFLTSGERRDIKYVLLTTEAGRAGLKVEPSEIQKFLKDPSKLNLAKSRFENGKDAEFKGKKFDEVRDSIVRDLIASSELEQIEKINEKLADQVAGLLGSNKTNDAKINALLKPYKVTVKTTGWVTRENAYLPGIGQASELMADAFAKKSPIDPSEGGRTKKYHSGSWVVVALIANKESPDLAKLQSQRDQLIRQITERKERSLYDTWMKSVVSRAKIVPNPKVLGDEET